MILPSPARLQSVQWQRDLADAITDPAELLRLLDLAPGDVPYTDFAGQDFAMRVPRYFAGLMKPGDPLDPLLAQVLPSTAERLSVAGYHSDPVGDLDAAHGDGLLKKYHGRALTVTTGACAVHCRYCFRRHFPYTGQSPLRDWQQLLARLAAMPDVNELILSGGDPLSLSDSRLEHLLIEAAGLDQLLRVRIHTRLPVVLPQRVTRDLCRMLANSRLRVVVVIHANHPNEVSGELAQAMRQLADAGATLLNQAVLLKSVNDSADTLAILSESLFAIGVMPYYLHLLDPVAGAAHFDVPLTRALALFEGLQARLPGYLVPRMVREVAGSAFKVPASQL